MTNTSLSWELELAIFHLVMLPRKIESLIASERNLLCGLASEWPQGLWGNAVRSSGKPHFSVLIDAISA